jgi:hypothetical protein
MGLALYLPVANKLVPGESYRRETHVRLLPCKKGA